MVQRHIYNYMFAKDEQPSYKVPLKPVGNWQLGENTAKSYTFKYMNDGFEDGKFLVELLQEKPAEDQPDQPDEGKSDASTDTPAEKPGDDHTESPSDRPNEKPGKDEQYEKPGKDARPGKPTEGPDSGHDESPVEKPDEKPSKPSDKTDDGRTEAPVEKPDDSKPETPDEQPDKGEVEKPTDQPNKPTEDDKAGSEETTDQPEKPSEDDDNNQSTEKGEDEEPTSEPDTGKTPSTPGLEKPYDTGKPANPEKPSQPTQPAKDHHPTSKPEDDQEQVDKTTGNDDQHDTEINDKANADGRNDGQTSESDANLDSALLQLGQPADNGKQAADSTTLPQTGNQLQGLVTGLLALVGSFLSLFMKKSQK